jgi:REP element-mobilizing transposase RayT
MTLDPAKGYRALRHGRYSQDGGEYFVTFCSEQRKPGLTTNSAGQAIVAEIQRMEAEAIWFMRCGVIMPDHIHLLFQLGEKLPLGKAIARFKSKSGTPLKACELRWQAGYFEHRLRPKEDPLPLFLYIYLNPYKAGLLPKDARWPWFICGKEDTAWFSSYLDEGLPEPAWIADLP